VGNRWVKTPLSLRQDKRVAAFFDLRKETALTPQRDVVVASKDGGDGHSRLEAKGQGHGTV